MPDEPRTPLTLEFEPDNIDDAELPEGYTSLVICEPSFQESGRIFLGVNPVGKRLGVHLLPTDARRVRDHLSKLLLEKADEDEPLPAEAEPVNARIERAVERLKHKQEFARSKPRRFSIQWPRFRFEFQVGRVQGVIGTVGKD